MAEMQAPSQLPPGSHDTRAPGYQAFLIFLVVLVTVTVTLRFWSRALGPKHAAGRHVHRFWWDDWIALVSAIIILAFIGLGLKEVHLGFGRHIWMAEPSNLPRIFRILYCIYFFYDVSLFLTKVSALLFLSRLFPSHTNNTLWNWSLIVAHGLNIAWLIGIIFGTVFMCNPVDKGWNPMLPGKCGTTSALWMGSAIPSVVIDFFILLLPLPKIVALQTSRKRKAGLLVVFTLGYGVIVVSLGRMITVLKSGETLNRDITYEGMPMVYWVTAEAPTTLICICLPPMLNLYRYLAASYITPISSRLSSLLSSRATGTVGFFTSKGSKSHSQTPSEAFSVSDTQKILTDGPLDAKRYSQIDGEKKVSPTEGRNKLGMYASQGQGAPYEELAGVEMKDLQPSQRRYLASVESVGRGSSTRDDDPTTTRAIRVNTDIFVSRDKNRA